MNAPALTARTYLGKTNGLLREMGPLGFAARVLRKIGHSVVDTGAVTFFVGTARRESPVSDESRFTVRQLHPADKAAVLAGSESTWESLRPRFEKGDLCFGALDSAGLAVHTRWVTLDRALVPELGLDFVPSPDAAYFYDGYTRPDARRQGVDALVRNTIFETVGRLGRTRVYSYVRNDNPAGLRAASRAQENVGSVRYVRVLNSAPRAFGMNRSELGNQLRSVDAARADASEAKDRANAWRGWFEGWLKEPMNRRSIGFHELPQEAFEAMAAHIASSLRLDKVRDSVLDLGCDSALVTRHVAPRCARLVGVDFIPGMLIDAKREREKKAPAVGVTMNFSGADGRALPFASGTFAKSYCTGVVHTLPTHADALKMILELARVTRPGGQAMVAAVPDVRKKWRARREAFRLGGFREKAHVIAAAALPRSARRLVRRIIPGLEEAPLRYLEFDLHEVGRMLRTRGYGCEVFDYPPDFWSRDFRETRANLLITVP